MEKYSFDGFSFIKKKIKESVGGEYGLEVGIKTECNVNGWCHPYVSKKIF